MIRITYDAGKTSIRVQGHAGYADPGQDIVCAAISALYCTLARSRSCIAHAEDDVQIVQATKVARRKMDVVFETIAGGMQEVAKRYPDFVSYEKI